MRQATSYTPEQLAAFNAWGLALEAGWRVLKRDPLAEGTDILRAIKSAAVKAGVRVLTASPEIGEEERRDLEHEIEEDPELDLAAQLEESNKLLDEMLIDRQTRLQAMQLAAQMVQSPGLTCTNVLAMARDIYEFLGGKR